MTTQNYLDKDKKFSEYDRLLNEAKRSNISEFTIKNVRTKESFQAKKVPEFMQRMLLEGGLVEYYKKYKCFPWIQR